MAAAKWHCAGEGGWCTLLEGDAVGGDIVPLDGSLFEGGRFGRRWCLACKQPILTQQRATRVEFQSDPEGLNGLTGEYHVERSKPFASLARVINLNPWGGR
jgi:hypothetical protein